MKREVACILSMLFVTYSYSQRIKELKIGDTLPAIEVNNILNFATTKANLADFKGKLLILDFWATWCSPCVKSFPKLDSLQKKYTNQLQILPVTYEDRGTVEAFIEKMRNAIKVTPSTVTSDSVLQKLFRHTEIPHYVWINKHGIIQAITGPDQLTDVNIQRLINDESAKLQTKVDLRRAVNITKPVFSVYIPVVRNKTITLDPVDDEDLLIHSSITRKMEGLASFLHIDSVTITLINRSIKSLYAFGLGRGEYQFLIPNRVVLEIRDSSVYSIVSSFNFETGKNAYGIEYTEWAKENSYCYELKVPYSMRQKKFEIMEQDLNRYFGYKYDIEGKREKKTVKCLVLVRTSKEDKMATKGGTSNSEENAFSFVLKNKPLNFLVQRFTMYYFQHLPTPVINEANYAGNVDINLNCKLSNLQDVNKELAKYGLQFIEAERSIDMIVIRDKHPGAIVSLDSN